MRLTNYILLDFNKEKQIDVPTIQYDVSSRFVRVALKHNASAINLSNVRVCVMVVRPDGKEFFNDCRIIDGKNGLIEFEITKQMGAILGEVECQIKLLGADSLLSSNIFKLNVSKTLNPPIDSSEEQLNTLLNILNDIQEIKNQVVILQGKPDIDDLHESYNTVWSSSKTKETITSMIAGLNPDVDIDLSAYQTKNDQSLSTTNKNIVGAINEVNNSVGRVNQDMTSVVSSVNKVNQDITGLNNNVNRIDQTVTGVAQDITGLNNNVNRIDQTVNDLKSSVGNGKQLIASAITDKGIDTSDTDTFEVMANKISQIETNQKASSLEIYYGTNEPQDVGNGAIWIPKLTKDKVKSIKITSEELPPNADSGSLYCRYTVLAVERYPLVELGGLFECRMFNFSLFTKGDLVVYEGFIYQNGQWIRVYNLEPFKQASFKYVPVANNLHVNFSPVRVQIKNHIVDTPQKHTFVVRCLPINNLYGFKYNPLQEIELNYHKE